MAWRRPGGSRGDADTAAHRAAALEPTSGVRTGVGFFIQGLAAALGKPVREQVLLVCQFLQGEFACQTT